MNADAMTRYRGGMRHLRLRTVAATLVAAVTVAITGCSTLPADAGDTGIDYAELQFHPSWPSDAFLSPDYAAGFGEWWRAPGHDSIICGVAHGIALVSEPSVSSDTEDPFHDRRGTLRGIRMHDNTEVWRLDNAACTSAAKLGEHVYVALGDFTEGSTVERLSIETGEHETRSESLQYLSVDRALLEIDDTVLVFASFDAKSSRLVSLDGNVAWINDWPQSWNGCHVLDGGPAAIPDELRLGCEHGGGFALIDPRSGEFTHGPNAWRTDGENIIWARDGYQLWGGASTRSTADNEEGVALESERFNFDGESLGWARHVLLSRITPFASQVKLPLEEIPLAAHVQAMTPTGEVIAYRTEAVDGLALVNSGSEISESGRLVAMSADGSILLFSSGNDLILRDGQGAELNTIPKPSLIDLLDGHIVRWQAGGIEAILLPAK